MSLNIMISHIISDSINQSQFLIDISGNQDSAVCRKSSISLNSQANPNPLFSSDVCVSNAYQCPYLLHVQHLSFGEGPLLPRPSKCMII